MRRKVQKSEKKLLSKRNTKITGRVIKKNEAHQAAGMSIDNFLSFPSKFRFSAKYSFLGQ